MEWIGLASDLKTVSPGMIAKRAKRTGDGSVTNSLGIAENLK